MSYSLNYCQKKTWTWSQELVGKIIIRTGPHPRTGDRSWLGDKIRVTSLSDKILRGVVVSESSFWVGKEVCLSMLLDEYGDGQWELN